MDIILKNGALRQFLIWNAKNCENLVEFFKDDITRTCSECGKKVVNDRDDYGCGQRCSSSSSHIRNFCARFRKSKDRSYGRVI